MIDPMASAVALGVLGALYHYLRWTAVPARWHDSRRAYRFRRVKDGLRELAADPEGPTDWQPHILAFTETPTRRERVLQVAGWMAGGSGMITAVQLITGDGASPVVRAQCKEAEVQLQAELERHHLDAYPLVVAAPDLRIGATTLLQSWGIGPVRSNTVLLNWLESRHPEQSPRRFPSGTHGCCNAPPGLASTSWCWRRGMAPGPPSRRSSQTSDESTSGGSKAIRLGWRSCLPT